MKVISLEAKRKQKNKKEIMKIPVYTKIRKDKNGELIGNLIDYVDIPKHVIQDNGGNNHERSYRSTW